MLAEEIREYRVKHSLTMENMASLCGISKATLVNVENGKQKATVITEGKIRRVLEGEYEQGRD